MGSMKHRRYRYYEYVYRSDPLLYTSSHCSLLYTVFSKKMNRNVCPSTLRLGINHLGRHPYCLTSSLQCGDISLDITYNTLWNNWLTFFGVAMHSCSLMVMFSMK